MGNKEQSFLYHGSVVPALTELLPFSTLHQSNQKVVYLSPSIAYAILYIWDCEKTQYPAKWVTGWLKDGIAYYEEQFPNQLKSFYEGVHGYVYSALRSGDMESVREREEMYYSKNPVKVYGITEIPDVYQALLAHERAGRFRVLRYEEAPLEKQAELTERIASYITENNLLYGNDAQSRFLKRYFVQAWEKAKEKESG